MEPGADRPTVELTPERVACARHGEPFRARWPQGFVKFSVELLDEAFEFSNETAEMVMVELDQIPLCERVSKNTLIRLYIESGIGRERPCQICHQTEMGSRYTTRNPDGTLRRWSHVGFRCVTEMELVN